MENETTHIDELILRYLDYTIEPQERNTLQQWLEQSEHNRTHFSQMRDAWLLSHAEHDDEPDTDAALSRLMARLVAQAPAPRGRVVPIGVLKVAAGIALLVATAITFFMLGGTYGAPEVVVQNRLITADDSRGRFVLPDSTVVWLNAKSVLQYPEEFTASTRQVTLEGQAYFEVAKDKAKPFIVHAGEMDVEVLGTHFQVSNYRHKRLVEAVLVEGSVKVAGCHMQQPVVLQPGQMLAYNKRSCDTAVSEVNTGNYVNWTQGRISFDNTPLSDILLNLEQWFATDIDCPPVLADNVKVTFTVRIGDTLDEILESLAMVAPIRYSKTDDVVQIASAK